MAECIFESPKPKEKLQGEPDNHQVPEEANGLAREYAIMAEIGQIISSSLDIDEVYERFAEQVNKIIPFDRIVINHIDIQKDTVINLYIAGKGIMDRKVGLVYPLEGSGNAREQHHDGKGKGFEPQNRN